MKHPHFLLIFSAFLISACSSNPANSDAKKKPIETNEWELEAEVEDAIDADSFLIVTNKYNTQTDQFDIEILTFQLADGTLQSRKERLNLGKKFQAPLQSGKYNMSGAYYPVQFDFKRNKAYFSIYEANELEGTFEYNKLVEYDFTKRTSREIASFDNYFISWYLESNHRKIYGFDLTKNSLISIDLKNSTIDTLMNFDRSFDDAEYFLSGKDKLEIIAANREEGVFRIDVNLQTNEVSKQSIAPATSYSSYRNGKVLETFLDHRNDIEELRLYEGEQQKSIPFDFKNLSTYWVSDSEFLVIKKDEIQRMNTDFKVIASFKLPNIHIIDVTSKFIFISHRENGKEAFALLDFNFENLVPITDVDNRSVAVIKEK